MPESHIRHLLHSESIAVSELLCCCVKCLLLPACVFSFEDCKFNRVGLLDPGAKASAGGMATATEFTILASIAIAKQATLALFAAIRRPPVQDSSAALNILLRIDWGAETATQCSVKTTIVLIWAETPPRERSIACAQCLAGMMVAPASPPQDAMHNQAIL